MRDLGTGATPVAISILSKISSLPLYNLNGQDFLDQTAD